MGDVMPLADAGPMSLDARRRRTAGLMAAQFDRPVAQDTFAQPMAPGTEVVERGGLVPLGTYSDGRTGLAWPGFITEPVQSFNRLLSQGYTSGDPQGAEDAFNVSGAAMLGGIAAPRPAARAVSSVPPPKPVSGWHGSGSELLDGFSSRFAGTGHGQASFGPGVYITGSKDLGEGYAKLAAHGGKPGYLHRVETGIDEARMLDFDAPMSQQSEHVLNALSSGANDALGIPRWTWGSMDKTAGHYITGRMRSGDDYALSKGLQNSGIPGIKYANRNAVNPGENLSNYVILDHSAPRVAETTRLYSGGGRPGAATGAALNAAGERAKIGKPRDPNTPPLGAQREGVQSRLRTDARTTGLDESTLESILKVYGLPYTVEASGNFSSFGPSNSKYYHIETPTGRQTVRLSDHDYASPSSGLDFRFGADPELASGRVAERFGIAPTPTAAEALQAASKQEAEARARNAAKTAAAQIKWQEEQARMRRLLGKDLYANGGRPGAAVGAATSAPQDNRELKSILDKYGLGNLLQPNDWASRMQPGDA